MTAHPDGAVRRQAAPDPAIPAVDCAGLRYSFGTHLAVDGVDLQIAAGRDVRPARPERGRQDDHHPDADHPAEPDEGTVTVFGVDAVAQPMLVRRLIGYVPQLLSADASLTGRENVELFARLFDVPRRVRGQRVDEALSAMGLTEAAQRLVKTYSGGMIRRLELAQALVNAPRLLILDEPTIGLDPIARADVWEFIAGLRRSSQTTVLMTTHYMDEADQYCDRVALMHRGTIRAIGTPAELKAGLGEGATLDDVFRHYTGGTLDDDSGARRHP